MPNYRIKQLLQLLGGAAFALAALAAQALPDDQQQPIHVTSDSAVQEENTVTYRGNVIVVQGSIRIEANEVVIKHDKGQLESAIATGNPVRFQQQPDADGGLITGHAGTVIYHATDQTVELLKNALVDRDKSTVRGNRIEYLLSSKTVRAEGSNGQQQGRVDMIFQPNATKPASPAPVPDKTPVAPAPASAPTSVPAPTPAPAQPSATQPAGAP